MASRHTETAHDCVVCGASLIRRDSERVAKFNARKTCSEQCKRRLITASHRAKYPRKKKKCQQCKLEFEKPYRETISRWESRKFCSQACVYNYLHSRTNPSELKNICGWCGEVRTKPKMISKSGWVRKKYCNEVCHRKAERFFRDLGRRYCKVCESQIYPMGVYSTDSEVWVRKEYCSSKCRIEEVRKASAPKSATPSRVESAHSVA